MSFPNLFTDFSDSDSDSPQSGFYSNEDGLVPSSALFNGGSDEGFMLVSDCAGGCPHGFAQHDEGLDIGGTYHMNQDDGLYQDDTTLDLIAAQDEPSL